MNNHIIAEEITSYAKNYFGDKLSAVLLYGSTLSARKKPNDLDIIVILKKRESIDDTFFFRTEIEKYNIQIDLQIINLEDINLDSFAHDAHGQFFVSFLRQAKPLFGVNPFLDLFPKYTKQVISVIQKAQYYYFRAKKVQANSVHPEDLGDLRYHRKKIVLMLTDFWLVYAGSVEVFDTQESLERVIKVLVNETPDQTALDFLLNDESSLKWQNIFMLYQKYYFAILDKLQPECIVNSAFVGEIHTDCYSIKSKYLAVIASGCPSDYDESEITTFLNVRGYDVALFHYTATGKSGGSHFRFPEADLADVIKYYESEYEKIIIIANSYGGCAALNLKKENLSKINKIIGVSPVVNLKNVAQINTLPDYLSSARRGWYRFDKEEFSQYILNSTNAVVIKPELVEIIHGINDKQIDCKDVISFCEYSNIKYKKLEAGHLSLNRLTREYLDSIHNMI